MEKEYKLTRKIMLKPFSLFYVFMSGWLFGLAVLMFIVQIWSSSIVILIGIIAALVLGLVHVEFIKVKSPVELKGYTIIMGDKK